MFSHSWQHQHELKGGLKYLQNVAGDNGPDSVFLTGFVWRTSAYKINCQCMVSGALMSCRQQHVVNIHEANNVVVVHTLYNLVEDNPALGTCSHHSQVAHSQGVDKLVAQKYRASADKNIANIDGHEQAANDLHSVVQDIFDKYHHGNFLLVNPASHFRAHTRQQMIAADFPRV